jgi:hypothetical protein
MEVNTGAPGSETTANQTSVPAGAAQAPQGGAGSTQNAQATTSGGSSGGAGQGNAAPDQAAQDAAAAAAIVAQYTPNYKFKANRKEMEFDEMFRPLVKDADSEKKIREWHEKFNGFDNLKQQHEEIFGKYSEVNGKYSSLDQTLTELSHHVQENDFDNFFARLKIPEAKIFGWVKKKLDEAALPPEEQQRIQESRQIKQQNHQFQNEHQKLMSDLHAERSRAGAAQLDFGLQQPEIAQFSQSFDAKAGAEGAFRSEVINAAIVHFQLTQQELTPQQAIEQVVKKFQWISQNPGAPGANDAAAANSTPASQQNNPQQQAKPKTTIPAVNGSGASVVKQKPKSIDDIRKIRDSMA